MDIKLICFDLDGTFLDEKKNIPDRNIKALEAAAAKGVHIVPSSGRTYAGMPDALRALPFIRYVIAANGAIIYDAKEDKVLSRSTIPLELALKFYDHADTLPVVYDCYTEQGGFTSQSMWPLYEKYIPDAELRKHVIAMRRPVPDLKTYLRETDSELLKMQMFFVDMEARLRQLEMLPGMFPELIFASSIPGNIEVNIAGGSKGQAMARLCNMLGLDISQSMALGDGSNDRDMITNAGIGVAMANADPALLEIADFVTGHCNDAGFAEAVERFVLS